MPLDIGGQKGRLAHKLLHVVLAKVPLPGGVGGSNLESQATISTHDMNMVTLPDTEFLHLLVGLNLGDGHEAGLGLPDLRADAGDCRVDRICEGSESQHEGFAGATLEGGEEAGCSS